MYELSECVWMCKCVCVCYVILLPSVRSNNWSCFSILTSFCITFSLPLPLSFSIYAASLIWSVKSRNTLRRSRGLGWVRVVVFTISRLTSTHCLSHIWLYLLFPPTLSLSNLIPAFSACQVFCAWLYPLSTVHCFLGHMSAGTVAAAVEWGMISSRARVESDIQIFMLFGHGQANYR